MGDGGTDGEFVFLEVGLRVRHEGVGHHGAVGYVFELHFVHDLHYVCLDLLLIDQTRVGDKPFELGDLSFEYSLRLLGGVILCILGEVSFVPSLGYLR